MRSLQLRCVYIQLCYVDACCFREVACSAVLPFTRSAVREQETPFQTMVLVGLGVGAVSFRAAICLQSKTLVQVMLLMEWDA
jgi:hypothetical protein